jgi:branched-chain amino acid transport system substrate-binding protein
MAVAAFLGCAAPAPEKNKIILGAPLSMAFLYGWDAEKNLRMAVDEINAAGGVKVGGKTFLLELVPIETRDLEPGVPVEEAIRAVEKLITEKNADIIIGGPVRSEAALAVMPTIAKYKKVHILTTGTLTPKLHKEIASNYDKYKYIFRITSEAAELAKEAHDILSSLKDRHGFSKVYIMVQDVAHARAIGNILKKMLLGEGGWEVWGPDIYPTGATDYSSSLLKAKDAKAEILFIWMDHPETSILARQWHELKIPSLPVAGINSFIEQPGSWKTSGGTINYWMGCPVNTGNAHSAYAPAMEYFNKHKEKFGIEPEGYGAVSSYAAVYVLKDAIERANSLDADAIVKALEETDYMGPYGRIRFDPKSHQVIPDYDPEKGAVPCWFQWQDGKRVQVWPPGVALSEIKIPPWM